MASMIPLRNVHYAAHNFQTVEHALVMRMAAHLVSPHTHWLVRLNAHSATSSCRTVTNAIPPLQTADSVILPSMPSTQTLTQMSASSVTYLFRTVLTVTAWSIALPAWIELMAFTIGLIGGAMDSHNAGCAVTICKDAIIARTWVVVLLVSTTLTR